MRVLDLLMDVQQRNTSEMFRGRQARGKQGNQEVKCFHFSQHTKEFVSLGNKHENAKVPQQIQCQCRRLISAVLSGLCVYRTYVLRV